MKFRFTALPLIVALSFSMACPAQDKQVDSLLIALKHAKEDTGKVSTLNLLSKKYFNTEPDKAILYGLQARDLAAKLNDNEGLAYAHKYVGLGYFNKGEYLEALKEDELSLDIFRSLMTKR